MADSKENKIIIHAAGGAGINQAIKIYDNVDHTYGTVIETNFIDTSMKNAMAYVDKIKIDEDLYIIKSMSHQNDDIDGSGGERSHNYEAITESVKMYLDHHRINKNVTGTFHIVLFSASGGSGSVIGPLIISEMLKRSIPVVACVTGDLNTVNFASNTSNTLASLDNISKSLNKPIPFYYINNTVVNNDNKGIRYENTNNIKDTIDNADKGLISFIQIFSIFASGKNRDIDSQDINTFLDFTKFKSIKIPVGLYGIVMTTNKLDNLTEKYFTPVIGRTLTFENISPDINSSMVNWKYGIIIDPDIKNHITEDNVPLHMLLGTGLMNKINKDVNDAIASSNEFVQKITADVMDNHATGHKTEDGMVL